MTDKRLLILFGPPAVGKMTVGKEVAERTGLKLFHNHMTIELVIQFFPFGSPAYRRLDTAFRRMIFTEVAQSDLPGLIFTFVWALELDEDKAFMDGVADIFRQEGGEVFYVELAAEQAVRLARNKTEFRLSQKPTKRNLVFSEQNLREMDAQYRLNSADDFFYSENYVKIDNTHLTPQETAVRICTAFGW